jgi:predicted XRE-type DNA-binding protein
MKSELEILTEQIRKLSQERIDKFGEDWFKKLKQQRKKPLKEYTKISQEQINIHIRNLEMYMALNRFSQAKTAFKIGVSRNVICDLKNGYCSGRTHEILSNFNYNL